MTSFVPKNTKTTLVSLCAKINLDFFLSVLAFSREADYPISKNSFGEVIKVKKSLAKQFCVDGGMPLQDQRRRLS